MKNRKLLLIVSLVLALSMSLGGTLAYLTDTDADVNVMTLGSVKIAQHEYERALNENGTYKTATNDNQTGYVLQDFTQMKPLLPTTELDANGNAINNGAGGYDRNLVYMTQVDSYGSMQVFTSKNAVDKFVTVENTGVSPAFVRTLIAFEAGSFDAKEWHNRVGISYHKNWTKSPDQGQEMIVKINGNNYLLMEFVYAGAKNDDGSWLRHDNGKLPGGATTYPSLAQVYLFNTATNEDLEALDGNKNGTYDIIVLSQAVQADGFADAQTALNTAFGEATATNVAEWFEGVQKSSAPAVVSNDAELKAALAGDASEIILKAGTYGVIDVRTNRAVTIYAQAGDKVTIAGINGTNNKNNTSNITIKNVTIDNSKQNEGWFSGTSYNMMPCVGVYGGDYTFENCTFIVSGESKAETGVMTSNVIDKGVLNFKNCTFNGGNDNARAMQIYDNYDLNVTNCTFNTKNDYSIKYVGELGTVATFTGNTVTATTNFVETGSEKYPGKDYTLVFENNTLANGIELYITANDENQTIITNGEAKKVKVVNSDAELKDALAGGASEIILKAGPYGVIDVRTNRAVTIYAQAGDEVTIAGINGTNNNNNTSNITIKGVTIDNSLQTAGWFSGTSYDMMPCVGVYGGNYTFENCTFKVSGVSKAETGVMTSNTIDKGVMTFTNCTFNGSNNSARAMQIYGNYDLNVTGCTFNTAKDYSIKYVGEADCVATFTSNNVNATTNFVQTGSAPYAGKNYKLVFTVNTLATGINHVYVDNAEGQTIIINGAQQVVTEGESY